MESQNKKKWSKLASLGFIFSISWIVFPMIAFFFRYFVTDGEYVLGSRYLAFLYYPIISMLLFSWLIISGLILSIIAYVKIRRNPALKGRPLALYGLVISGMVLTALFLFVVVNILSHQPHIGPSCQTAPGLGCVNFYAKPNSFSFTLRNNMVEDLEYFSMRIEGTVLDKAPLASDWIVESEHGTFSVVKDEAINAINITSNEGDLLRNMQEILVVTAVPSNGKWSGRVDADFHFVWRRSGVQRYDSSSGRLILPVER